MLRNQFSKILLGATLLCSASAFAHEAWTTRQVNARAGPDATYPVVATLAGDYPVDVAGCLSDYSWCDVVFNGDRGWVPGRRLHYSYQSRRVPLYDYGARIGLPIVSFSLLNYWDSYYSARPFYQDRPRWYNAPRANWAYEHDRRDDWRDDRHDNWRDNRHDNWRDDRHDNWRDNRRDNWRDRSPPQQFREGPRDRSQYGQHAPEQQYRQPEQPAQAQPQFRRPDLPAQPQPQYRRPELQAQPQYRGQPDRQYLQQDGRPGREQPQPQPQMAPQPRMSQVAQPMPAPQAAPSMMRAPPSAPPMPAPQPLLPRAERPRQAPADNPASHGPQGREPGGN